MARCTADTLDAADDVCDGCGDPFCEDHLIRPRGSKKKPLCRECAVARAGLRHKELRTQKASRTAVRKKRKAVKKDDSTSDEAPFVYFDEADGAPSAAPVEAAAEAEETAEPKKKRRRKRKQDAAAADTVTTDDESTEAEIEASKSAADLWEQIRSDEGDTAPTMSLAAPEPEDDPWAAPDTYEPEPERGMPATFAAPRSVAPPNHLDPIEHEAAAPAPATPPPPQPEPGSLAPPPPPPPVPGPVESPVAAVPDPVVAATPTPEPVEEIVEEEPPPPPVAWKAAPTEDIDFGFDAVEAVDGLGRRLQPETPTATAEVAPEPAEEPTPVRKIPPAFAERPAHQPPAALRSAAATPPAATNDPTPAGLRAKPAGSTTPTTVPDALKPAAASDDRDVPDALRPS